MPRIRIAYEVWTEEDAAVGETDTKGWENEEGIDCTPDTYDIDEGIDTPVKNAVHQLRNSYTTEASSSQFHPGVWYIGHVNSYRDAEETTYTYHLDGFTAQEEEHIYTTMHTIL